MAETGIQTTRWVRQAGSWWKLVLGWLCIAAGLAGIVLPIIPGIPLLIFGLVLLSSQYHWAHKAVVWMKRRFQREPR